MHGDVPTAHRELAASLETSSGLSVMMVWEDRRTVGRIQWAVAGRPPRQAYGYPKAAASDQQSGIKRR